MAKHTPVPCPQHPTYDIRKVVRAALEEDAGDRGDITTLSTVPAETQAVATFLAKAEGVIAGLGVADMVLQEVDPTVKVDWQICDGDRVKPGQILGSMRGSARAILVAERIMLNFMQRMSGIATATAAMVAATNGLPTKVLETRKTVPGLRMLDKWAVLIGGGANHRLGLFDMMMIKDNHIAAAGGIRAAVMRAEKYIREEGLVGKVGVEVETRTMAEVDEILEVMRDLEHQHKEQQQQQQAAAAAAGSAADAEPGASGSGGDGALARAVARGHHVVRVMLDNMARQDAGKEGGVDVTMLAEAVGRIGDAVETEASGNVTLASIRPIAATGVTYVSVGALTHSVTALDISLNIETQ